MAELLFLSHRIPYPPTKGEKIRAWHFLERLSQRFTMRVGCFVDDEDDWRHVETLRACCAEVACVKFDKRRARLRAMARLRPGTPLTLAYFEDRGLRRWVADTLAQPAVAGAFVFSSGMADYVMRGGGKPRVLDMVDVDSEKFAAYAERSGWPARFVWAREGRQLLAFERRAANDFTRTLFVSPAECARFAALAPETTSRIDWVENGVDLARFAPTADRANPYPDAAPRIVFTGTMDYWPNVDAVTWFVREVMPLLRDRGTPARFAIVGANAGADVQALAGERVAVTGRVEDVRGYVQHAAVAVAPLRIARGIQNKVLEAMAMARPVVATREAFEGVRAEEGRDLLVADGAAAFAAAVDAVLDGAHAGLGAAARRAMEAGHGWDATLAKLDTVMSDLLEAASR